MRVRDQPTNYAVYCNEKGAVAPQDVPDFLHELDIFLYPTFGDSFGYVVAEAVSMGLPIVATRVGAIPEFVENGTTGFLVRPHWQDPRGEHLPLITSDEDNIVEVAGADDTTTTERLLVASEDQAVHVISDDFVLEMASFVMELVLDAPLRLRMGRRGRTRLQRKGTSSRGFADAHATLYENLYWRGAGTRDPASIFRRAIDFAVYAETFAISLPNFDNNTQTPLSEPKTKKNGTMPITPVAPYRVRKSPKTWAALAKPRVPLHWDDDTEDGSSSPSSVSKDIVVEEEIGALHSLSSEATVSTMPSKSLAWWWGTEHAYSTYVINLDRSFDRLEQFWINAANNGLDPLSITRVRAVDGHRMQRIVDSNLSQPIDGIPLDAYFIIEGQESDDGDKLENDGLSVRVIDMSDLFRWSPASVAVSLSHLKAIRTAYDAGDEMALILEDDVEFLVDGTATFGGGLLENIKYQSLKDRDGLSGIIDAAQGVPDWTILQLGYIPELGGTDSSDALAALTHAWRRGLSLVPRLPCGNADWRIHGLHSYLIHRRGMKFLLDSWWPGGSDGGRSSAESSGGSNYDFDLRLAGRIFSESIILTIPGVYTATRPLFGQRLVMTNTHLDSFNLEEKTWTAILAQIGVDLAFKDHPGRQDFDELEEESATVRHPPKTNTVPSPRRLPHHFARGVQYAPPPLVIVDPDASEADRREVESRIRLRMWMEQDVIDEYWPWFPGAHNISPGSKFQNFRRAYSGNADICHNPNSVEFAILPRKIQAYCRQVAFTLHTFLGTCLASGAVRSDPLPAYPGESAPFPLTEEGIAYHEKLQEQYAVRLREAQRELAVKRGEEYAPDENNTSTSNVRQFYWKMRLHRRPHGSVAASLARKERLDILIYVVARQPQVAIFKESDLKPRGSVLSTFGHEDVQEYDNDGSGAAPDSTAAEERAYGLRVNAPMHPYEAALWHCGREAQLGATACGVMEKGFLLIVGALWSSRSAKDCVVDKGTGRVVCHADRESNDATREQVGDGHPRTATSAKFNQSAYDQRHGFQTTGGTTKSSKDS